MFINTPFTAPIEKLRMRVDIKELKEGISTTPFNLEARSLIHADLCFGYRFKLEGKVITYCTDTGVCENLEKLATNADLLITECAWKKKNQSVSWPHLSPYDAAEVALKAKVKKLVLTHFGVTEYNTKQERKWAELEAKKIFPSTRAAFDGLKLKL